MYVFEITTPGTWIEKLDRESSWRIRQQIDHLISQFHDANVALNLFSQAQATRQSRFDKDSWDRDSKRKSEIRNQVEEEFGNSHDSAIWDEISFETDLRFSREQWSQGMAPRTFEHTLPFIFAKAFLYALDGFDKFLGVLAKDKDAPQQIVSLHDEIARVFPHLRGVRNTSQHLEDRSRGLGGGKNPKPLDLKPVDNGMINAPGGVLVLNNLNGSKYGATMSDGHLGEVDVSVESMQQMQRILQEVLNNFHWKGPKQLSPR